MATALLVVIYVAFIGLGLPDGVYGAAWPAMQSSLGVQLDAGGIVSSVVAAGTVASALSVSFLVRRLGTGLVALLSTALTACALIGYSAVPTFWWLLLPAIPLGLGAGAVDASLNDYVARHYEARHMNWLHGFWGLGAVAGPGVMSALLSAGWSWRTGYLVLAASQTTIVVLLLITIRWWQRAETLPRIAAEKTTLPVELEAKSPPVSSNWQAMSVPGVKAAMLCFVAYSLMESSTNLWSASFMVQRHGLEPANAAAWSSAFFVGVTVGRLGSGALSLRLPTPQLISIGISMACVATAALSLPLPSLVHGIAIIILGLGLAPIFPGLLHLTPAHFGPFLSQRVIGLQMAAGYTSTTLLPPLVGAIGRLTKMTALGPVLLLGAVFITFAYMRLRRAASGTGVSP